MTSPAPSGTAVSFGQRIADLAADHPDGPALIFAPIGGEDRAVSWAELDRRGNQVARLLARHGVGPTSLVVIALGNGVDHCVTALGAWRLGACVLPLRADLPPWEQERLLAAAGADLVVGQWTVPAGAIPLEEVLESTRLPDDPLPDVIPDPAIAVASSGSTGFPKLIVSPEPGLFDTTRPAYASAERMGAGRGQVQLIPGPLYHTNGFRITHGALHRDELVVLMERFDAARAVELIEAHQITTVTMAPTMLLRIARLPDIAQRDLSSLRSLLQGAGPCPEWLIRWWIDRVGPDRFFVSYGASERVGLTMLDGNEWLAHPGSVGRGMETDLRILDDQGEELGPGRLGNVYLRDRSGRGPRYRYRGAPPAPETADGFTTVGDLGWLDEDGYLYLADRRSDMIVSGGANVFPAEVEAALLEHPGVDDAAVIGLPDEEWGQRVHALVQASGGPHRPTPAELEAHCRDRLARYKVPKDFEMVDALPRTEAGKLNRSQLLAERTGR